MYYNADQLGLVPVQVKELKRLVDEKFDRVTKTHKRQREELLEILENTKRRNWKLQWKPLTQAQIDSEIQADDYRYGSPEWKKNSLNERLEPFRRVVANAPFEEMLVYIAIQNYSWLIGTTGGKKD